MHERIVHVVLRVRVMHAPLHKLHTPWQHSERVSVILQDITMYPATTGAWLLTQRDGSHLPKGEPSSRVSEVRPAIADVLRLRAL